jgi:hypothetical protein
LTKILAKISKKGEEPTKSRKMRDGEMRVMIRSGALCWKRDGKD